VASDWPTYDSRRISAQLRRQGFVVNRKRVMRLMGEMGLEGKTYRKKRRTTNSGHPFPRYANLVQSLEVVRPDRV
jgi:transposase InsO family protein